MKDRRLGLIVVGAAAITALLVAEPKAEELGVEATRSAATHVHPVGSVEPCMIEELAIAAQPVVQSAGAQAC